MSQQVAPVVPVVVELGHKLLTDSARDISQQFAGPIAERLAELLHQLGIPGVPNVEVKSSVATLRTRVTVNGSLQAYSLELIQRLCEYVSKSEPRPLSSSSWESEIKEAVPEEDLGEFVAQLVVHAAKQRLETLLSDEQAAAYLQLAESVMGHASAPHLNNLPLETTTNVLRYLLKLGLSIGDHRVVVEYIADGLAQKRHDDDIAETLVSRLIPYEIEIEMNASYLRQIAQVSLGEGQWVSVHDSDKHDKVREQFGVAADALFKVREQFDVAADALFYELGIRIPNIVLVASENIKEQAFSVKINHIASCIPRFGLSPGQLLVNAPVSDLNQIEKDEPNVEKKGPQLLGNWIQSWRHKPAQASVGEKKSTGISASKAINPGDDTEGSIIDEKDRQTVEKDKRLYVWDQIGYVVLALTKELRRNAWRLLHNEPVEYELAQLHQVFPELVLATMENISLSHLTRILRELLKEAISIRDLRAILERILTCDYIVTGPIKLTVFDDRLAFREQPQDDWRNDPRHYAQFVRSGLKRYVSHKLALGETTVFALDEKIEGQILDHLAAKRGAKVNGALTATQIEEILAAIRSKVSSQKTPSGALPVILTISEIRAFIRQIVEPEFPNLFVASHDELSPDSNIQPIATISVSDSVV